MGKARLGYFWHGRGGLPSLVQLTLFYPTPHHVIPILNYYTRSHVSISYLPWWGHFINPIAIIPTAIVPTAIILTTTRGGRVGTGYGVGLMAVRICLFVCSLFYGTSRFFVDSRPIKTSNIYCNLGVLYRFRLNVKK